MDYYTYYMNLGHIKQKTASLEQRAYEEGLESAEELRYLVHSIDQLAKDLGRVLLKTQALTELLIESGIVDPARLEEMSKKVDELDGSFDGVLNPAVFRTEAELDEFVPTRILLTKLEDEDQAETPEEFLSRMEHEEEEKPETD